MSPDAYHHLYGPRTAVPVLLAAAVFLGWQALRWWDRRACLFAVVTDGIGDAR
jgi:hypothetical protein